MNFVNCPIPEGSNCLVIGGNRGLGLEITKYLLLNNINTIITTRNTNNILDNLLSSFNSSNTSISTLSNPSDNSNTSTSNNSNRIFQIITNIELEDENVGQKIISSLPENYHIDYLLLIAGYFTTETFEVLNISEERKMMEICAFAPLRIIQNLVLSNHLKSGSKIGMITSEGGSIGLRLEAEGGGNYGHHMSKCAQVSYFIYFSYLIIIIFTVSYNK